MKRTMLIVVAMLVLATAAFAADTTATAVPQLSVSATVASAVDFSFDTQANNSDITRTSATAASKSVALSNAAGYTKSFAVNFLATIYNTTGTTGTLKANLTDAIGDANLAYLVNDVPLVQTTNTDVGTATLGYGTPTQISSTVKVTATNAVPAGSYSNTINFTLVVN